MKKKCLLSFTILLVFFQVGRCQSPKDTHINITGSSYIISYTFKGTDLQIDGTGQLVKATAATKKYKKNLARLKYWGEGWGAKSGKLQSIGKLAIEYWGKGWGDKEGKIRSFGRIQLDYWDRSWGKTIAGNLRSIDNVTVTYLGDSWGDKACKIRSIEGTDKNAGISGLMAFKD